MSTHVSRVHTRTMPRSRRHANGSSCARGSPAPTMKPIAGHRVATDTKVAARKAALVRMPGRNAASARPDRTAKNAAIAGAKKAPVQREEYVSVDLGMREQAVGNR